MSFSANFETSKSLEGSVLMHQVKNLMVVPNWIGAEDRFWIKLQDQKGHHFYIVNAATGEKLSAFDHAAVAQSLSAAGAGEQHEEALGLSNMTVEGDERVLTVGPNAYRCTSDGSVCRKLPTVTATEWLSPDGRYAAFIRDHNLWVREGAGGAERALTKDGTPTHSYGTPREYEFTEVQLRRAGKEPIPRGVIWSPNGQYLVAFRNDVTEVPERTHVAEFAAPDLLYIHSIQRRIELPGDNRLSQRTVTIVNLAAQRAYPAQLTSDQLQDWAWMAAYEGSCLWWQAGGKLLFLPVANWRGNRYGIAQLELSSGQARAVVEESEDYAYMFSGAIYSNPPSFHVLSDGRELIWYSNRSGYGHLYLYDVVHGKLKHPLTQGDWVVYGIQHVDERARQVYFTAAGKEAGRNPYYRHLYKVSLDGGKPQLLTPADADHEFDRPPHSTASIAPNGRYFVDAFSTVTQATVAVLRRSDGTQVSELYRADASALDNVPGWRAPEPMVTLAADGKTQLYGLIYKPYDFDSAKSYPVVDMSYPGPQGKFTPTNFAAGFQAMLGNPQQTANLGLIVVAFDARGCGGRDHAFVYAHSGTEDLFGSADHVAAIKHLASQNAYMDAERVGIYGVSWGGYGALRAQLLHGDFFKVCVSVVGPTDWHRCAGGSTVTDRYFRISDDPKKAQEYFELLGNVRLAGRLQGKLLLIYGEIDENVPLHNAFLIFEALQKADKDYDTVLLTNQSHAAFTAPYCVRRTLQFFCEHLQAGT